MKASVPPKPRAIVATQTSRWSSTGTALVAAGAMAALLLGIVIGAGRSHAGVHPQSVQQTTAPGTWDSNVPRGSDLFVDPESGAVISAAKR